MGIDRIWKRMLKHPIVPCLAAALVCAALSPAAAAADDDRRPGALRAPAPAGPGWKDGGSLSLRLDERLRREASRFTDLAAPAPEPLADPDLEADEESRATRARRVERLLTRAIRGALDDHLSDLARTSPAFEGLFRILDARDPRAEDRRVPLLPSAEAAAAGPARRFEAAFRVRIDAHPRLQLRARMGAVTGSIEIPVLDPELRIGLERPLGARGRAALQGGWSDGRGDWAALALSYSF